MTFVADVLIEIPLRLPVKQLCQLKIVSQQWLLIISSPHFKILYNERSIRSPRLLIVEESGEGHTLATYYGLLSRTLHISTMDISTGIIRREFSRNVRGHHYSFLSICNFFCYSHCGSFVFNPTTHELGCLPSRTFPAYDFYVGYLADTNEYKIVDVFGVNKTYEGDGKVRFQILTLKDGEPIPSSWRIIENYTPTWSYNTTSVSIKCSIYWLVYSRDRRKKSIISIELKSERFTTICCPEVSPAPDYENGDHEQLTEIKGHLCLAHFSKKYSTAIIFVLKAHDNHIRVKECSINLSNMVESYTVVIGYLPADNDNGEILFHCYNGKLFSYNVKELLEGWDAQKYQEDIMSVSTLIGFSLLEEGKRNL